MLGSPQWGGKEGRSTSSPDGRLPAPAQRACLEAGSVSGPSHGHAAFNSHFTSLVPVSLHVATGLEESFPELVPLQRELSTSTCEWQVVEGVGVRRRGLKPWGS